MCDMHVAFVSTNDARGKVSYTEYDAETGLLQRVTDAQAQQVSNTYDNWAYTWQKGRQLAKMANAARGFEVQYTYNVDGLRVGKKVVWYDQPDVDAPAAGETTYTLNGKQILHMDCRCEKLDFAYGAQGKPAFVRYGGSKYAYVYNLQGDVVALLASTGETVVQYEYDAWGKPVTMTGELADTLGRLNPFRYRGYVFDEETGLYYVSSRYYDPEIGRWINADDTAYLGADGTILSYNLFAYCKNNPVMGYDPTGHFSWTDVFNIAAVVTIAALAIIAIVGSGGSAAPPLLAAASALAGTTVTAAAATTVATGVAITGVATMGAAATASILESSSKQGKDYVQARNNKQANQWAQEVGYDGAEELKADYVGKQGSKFNMYANRATGEIILIGLKVAKEIATQLFRW